MDLNRKLIHCRLTFSFSLVEKDHLSSTVELFQLLYNKTFSILPLPEDFSYEFLEQLFIFSSIPCTANSSFSGNDQITGSPGRVPCVQKAAVFCFSTLQGVLIELFSLGAMICSQFKEIEDFSMLTKNPFPF